jgi:hypothetical protein
MLPSATSPFEGGADVADAKNTESESLPSSVRITVIVQNRYMFDTEVVTGRQIKDATNIPADFGLYRRVQGGNEPIPDDALVELRNGDHFFARPTSDVSRRSDVPLAGGHGDDDRPRAESEEGP